MEMLKVLRLLGDKGRIRILRLLQSEDLSVAELQEILEMGQSTISMQLSQLKQAGFVEVRKAGQKSMYRALNPPGTQTILAEVLRGSAGEIPEIAQDDLGLHLILDRRKDRLRGYFDELAGRFGRNYVPGRGWQAMAEMLLRLMPPLTIADLGAGEGTISLMLAQQALKVIAVDSSVKMVEYGSGLAQRYGVDNLDYRLGDLEDLPLADGEVDLALMHQTLHHALHPRTAIKEAWRVLKPGGRILVLDLVKHEFEAARELYADVWLGFSQVELMELLAEAGFEAIGLSVVHEEEEAPHFRTLMATGIKRV
jgi:ArsR family transcriptional regulator